MKNDRRAEKRYDMLLKVEYRDSSTSSHGEGLTKNICRTGIRLLVNADIAKDAVLEVKIEDPNSSTLISTEAKVAWIEKFVTGDDAEDVAYEAGMKLLKNRLY